MALARHQFTVTDELGNVVPAAHIEVRREIPGQPLAQLFSDRGGATGLGNPFDADENGFAAFHVIGGAYQIKASLGEYSQTWRYVGIGTASELDVAAQFNDQGAFDIDASYSKWDMVVGNGSSFVYINDTAGVGHALPTYPTTVNDYWQMIALAGSPGGPLTIPYTFSTTTADGSPGDGKLRLGSATQNASTVIRVDLEDNLGSTWTGVLDTMDASTSTIKGFIKLQHAFDETKWLEFSLSARAAASDYRNFTVECIGYSAASPFANNDPLLFEFLRNGDKGEKGLKGDDGIAFSPDEVVPDLAGRDAFDAEDKNFAVLVESDSSNDDLPTLYFKLSATSGDWSVGFTFEGTGGSGGGFKVSDTAPDDPKNGERWLDSTSGIEYTWVDDGDSGQWVEVGPFAIQGDAATIEVGTVTSVAAGSPATVTNSGTSGAAVLDFEIPAGNDGDTGPAAWLSPVAWTTGVAFVSGPPASVVTEDGETYVCLEDHTSGTFATDLAAGKWIKVAAKGASGGDVAGDTHAATSKTTPVDADELPLVDSAASNVLKKLTWANLKTALSTGGSSSVFTPGQFGAVGDGTTDDSVALQDLFDHIAGLSASFATYPVSGEGKTYATSEPIDLCSFIDLRDIEFKALAGSNWSGCSKSGTGNAITFTPGTNGVINIVNKGFIRLTNVSVDANRITNVQCFYGSGPNYQIVWDGGFCRHWKTGGTGVVISAFGFTYFGNVDIQQYIDGDAEYGVAANWIGFGLGFFNAHDGLYANGVQVANCLVPLYIDSSSSENRFIGIHPYNVTTGGTPTANPYGIIHDGYSNTFTDTYLDVVPFLIRTKSGATVERPSLIVTGTKALYNSAISTFGAWFQFTTDKASTPLYGAIIRDNSLPGTAAAFSFATTGSGSWGLSSAAMTALGAATGDSSIIEPGGSTTEFSCNLNLLGVSTLQGQLVGTATDTGTSHTLSADNSGKVLLLTSGSAIAVTAPKAMTKNMGQWIYCPNHSATLTAESGATINGVTTGITLGQNKLYYITMYFGSGSNAQYGLMGSGI